MPVVKTANYEPMKTTKSPPERAAAIMAHLRSLKKDRGAMSNLRCALIPARRHRAWPLLARIGGIDDEIAEAVAGCYAYHPEEAHEGNLGETCRLLAGSHTSFDARFRRLLACDRGELCERIRQVVLAAKSKGIPVNYEVLLADLLWWGDHVRIRWAQAYWRYEATEETAKPIDAEAL
jgi:CRISPR type I-E-associated protein CasB/Cse2